MFQTFISMYGLLALLISIGVGKASFIPPAPPTDTTYPLYLKQGPSYDDVKQGNWETSSLLATLASVALGTGGSQQLQKAFKFDDCEKKPTSPNLNDAGFYIFNLKDGLGTKQQYKAGDHNIDQTTWEVNQDVNPSLFNVKRTDVYNAGAFDDATWWVGGYENAMKTFWKNDTNILKNVPAAQYLTHLTGRSGIWERPLNQDEAFDIGKRAPGTPIIIDTKATTKKLSQSHHYSVVKTYIYEKDKKAWIRLGDPKGGEKEWLLSDVIGDINGMSRFLYYDTFSDTDRFIPLPTLVPETVLIPETLTSRPTMPSPSSS